MRGEDTPGYGLGLGARVLTQGRSLRNRWDSPAFPLTACREHGGIFQHPCGAGSISHFRALTIGQCLHSLRDAPSNRSEPSDGIRGELVHGYHASRFISSLWADSGDRVPSGNRVASPDGTLADVYSRGGVEANEPHPRDSSGSQFSFDGSATFPRER